MLPSILVLNWPDLFLGIDLYLVKQTYGGLHVWNGGRFTVEKFSNYQRFNQTFELIANTMFCDNK